MYQEYHYLDFVISCKSENIKYGQHLTVKKQVNWIHRQILSNINLSISSSISMCNYFWESSSTLLYSIWRIIHRFGFKNICIAYIWDM